MGNDSYNQRATFSSGKFKYFGDRHVWLSLYGED